ncbi:hypothetical protein QYE76_002062 [Lolium multiflorum]|uniref:Uncharacterized protein n=1 Tax=Lolium multiflorum TaxID=4521 RepID=A0AAD8RP00_LOLMU|nr:hypothetical protein QYE76_002062 [Lolium multiflorum]
MALWTKLTKHTSPMATEGLQSSEWERSRISNQDVNLLKKLGFMKKENTLIFPGEESYPTPRIGYRALAKANKRADDLALELAKSEKAREKAELESASVESLRKRLHDAENALSECIYQQIAREAGIAARLELQNHRFVRKTSQEYQLEKPEDDRLLDALSLLLIYGDEARQRISDAKAGFSRLFPYFFPKTEEPNTFAALAKRFIPKEDLGLALRQVIRVDAHVRWEPQVEGMMRIEASFPQYETKVIESVGAKKHVKVVGEGV